MKKELWAFNDNKAWGKQFVLAAGRAGIKAHLFTDVEQVPKNAVVFSRLDQEGLQLEISKHIARCLNERGIKTLPNILDAELYDDKRIQTELLSHHMPKTLYIQSEEEANKAFASAVYPFISKSHTGSASRGVRLIETPQQARKEIEQAFRGRGIDTGSYGRRQSGYLLWQEFVKDQRGDYRIYVIGDMYFGAFRSNRAGTPFASGSGIRDAITPHDDEKCLKAFDKAFMVTNELGTKWQAYDFVFKGGEALLVECSCAWPPHWLPWGECFTRDGKGKWSRNGLYGGHMFDVAVKIMLGDEYQC